METSFTKNFESFVNSCDLDWQEIYELFLAATGNSNTLAILSVEKTNGHEDTIIFHKGLNKAIRLTPEARDYFPTWIEQNLMNGLDAETFWALKSAEERDKD